MAPCLITMILQTRGTFTRFWDQGCRGGPGPQKVQGLFPNLVNGRPSLNKVDAPIPDRNPSTIYGVLEFRSCWDQCLGRFWVITG